MDTTHPPTPALLELVSSLLDVLVCSLQFPKSGAAFDLGRFFVALAMQDCKVVRSLKGSLHVRQRDMNGIGIDVDVEI